MNRSGVSPASGVRLIAPAVVALLRRRAVVAQTVGAAVEHATQAGDARLSGERLERGAEGFGVD